MTMRRRTARDERGAVAVVFAILSVVMLGVAALGVDLGNAMNRKKQNATSADFAALAGAFRLPGGTAVAETAAREAVANYLNKNQPATDGNECNSDPGPWTESDLSDGNVANGEVTFPATTRIHVVAPATRVQFGLANAVGFDDTCVQSQATARITSSGTGLAPYYATNACSSGPQVLKSDAGGPSIPYSVPVLSHDSETNTSVLSGNLLPNQVPLVAADATPSAGITITGTNLGAADIDTVGFFNSDQSEPIIATPTSQNASGITVTVPVAVQSRQDVWWVRVHHKPHDAAAVPPVPTTPADNQWSARPEARPLLVGDAVLSCDPASATGNFGSIDLPHGNSNAQTDLELNIQFGLLAPLGLKAYPGPPFPPATPTASDCAHQPAGVTSTDDLRKPDTNCVESVPGLKALPAYDGYLQNSTPKGKLRVDTSPTCMAAPQNRPARRSMPTGESINDDTLSCFLKDDTLHLSDAIGYTGASPLFEQSIWKSPRFVQVPIIDSDPSGTAWMPILRFVPGFITDEVTGSSRPSPLFSGQTLDGNGLVVENPQKLRAIRIFFFSVAALPPPPDGGPKQDFIGSGPKGVALVN